MDAPIRIEASEQPSGQPARSAARRAWAVGVNPVRSRPIGGPALLGGAALSALLFVQGCSLAVMGGKMLFGDPVVRSQFRKATHTDLVKLNARVVLLCSGSDVVRSSYPSAEYDVLEGVTHRLKANGIKKIVSPDLVATWIDDHGGRIDDLQEMAEHFKAEYVIHIELTKFTCIEENSPNLLRGQSEGRVHAYQLDERSAPKRLLEIMNSDFVSTYPPGNPVSIDKKSAKNFEQEYIERISLQLAQIFYDHSVGDEMQ